MKLTKFVLMLGLISVAGTAITASGLEKEPTPSSVESSGAVSPEKLTREELKVKLAAARREATRKGYAVDMRSILKINAAVAGEEHTIAHEKWLAAQQVADASNSSVEE